jgi:hypothetical protein
MFWIVLAPVGFPALLLKLGALYDWEPLLSFALLVVGGLATLGAVVILWRRLLRRARCHLSRLCAQGWAFNRFGSRLADRRVPGPEGEPVVRGDDQRVTGGWLGCRPEPSTRVTRLSLKPHP